MSSTSPGWHAFSWVLHNRPTPWDQVPVCLVLEKSMRSFPTARVRSPALAGGEQTGADLSGRPPGGGSMVGATFQGSRGEGGGLQ